MMLTIESEGAQLLLALLERIGKGQHPADADVQPVLAANEFFVRFYCQWKDVTPERLVEAMRRFAEPEWNPSGQVLTALSRGFRHAAGHAGLLQGKLDTLRAVDASALVGRATAHLPAGTPLQSTIHLTVDDFNGGFQYQGEIGLSLLRDNTNPAQFEPLVAHELHHVGFGHWVARDPVRQAVLAEHSGRAIAMRHVQNLLLEGTAIHYCSPFPQPDEAAGSTDPGYARFLDKLARFRREERAWFERAERVLTLSLQADADYATCKEAAEAIAFDMEGIEPAGHYIGSRMVEIMSRFHAHERIIACIRNLADFLPLYNQAAQDAEAFIYDPAIVERFTQLWESAAA